MAGNQVHRYHATCTWSGSRVELTLSADPAFRGDAALLDPEHRGDADAVPDETERPVRVTEIHLRPRISVRGPVSEPRILSLVQTAHRECFVANSLNCEITVTPSVTVVE